MRFHENVGQELGLSYKNQGLVGWCPGALGKLTHILVDWNKDAFGNIFFKKKKIKRRLDGVQSALPVATIASLLKLESRLKRDWEDMLLQEEIVWKQKSRASWLRFGDKNTRYFHTTTLISRRNKLEALQDDHGE